MYKRTSRPINSDNLKPAKLMSNNKGLSVWKHIYSKEWRIFNGFELWPDTSISIVRPYPRVKFVA